MVYFGGHKKRLSFSFLCSVFAFLILVLSPIQTFALSHYNHIVFKENNVLFWNPDEGCDTSVEIIGDSITVQAQSSLQAALPDATINAEWGRPWSKKGNAANMASGLEIINGGVTANILVWLLGTNDFAAGGITGNGGGPLEESDVVALHNAVGPNTQVILMTSYDSYGDNNSTRYAGNNDLIRSAVEKYENFHLFDWNAMASPDLTRIDNDYESGGSYGIFGVHLNSAGIEAFTAGVTSAVEEQRTDIQNFCNSRFNRNGACDALIVDTGDNAATIFQYLTSQGFSETAAAAIMGNLFAESHLEPRQLEKISSNSSYSGYLAPEGFVAYKNGSKTYSGGFGIAQWTSAGRVKKLQEFADSQGMPVTSIAVQTKFLVKELSEYGITPSTLNSLSLGAATELVLKKYEAPANQSSTVVNTRTSYAQKYTGLTPGASGLCNEVSTATLKSGGLTLSEAQNSIMAAYRAISPREVSQNPELKKFGISSNSCKGSDLENCVSFVKWFAYTYTNTYVGTAGNGRDVAGNLIRSYGWTNGGHTPQTYAVFSTGKGSTTCSNGQKCGHTGVVLGIDKEKDEIIIGEAGCSAGYSWTGAHRYRLSTYASSAYTYAYPPHVNI